MQATYENLASRAIQKYNDLQSSHLDNRRLLIALAGPPGSGKTTIATHVAAHINKQLGNPNSALVVSIDGFHLPRKALDALPNKEEAYARRGAHWTFDATAAAHLVQEARTCEKTLYAPTFDHAVKDPVANGLVIPVHMPILIFEGNYLLCDLEPWVDIANCVDERWFVNVEPEKARYRVARRHVEAGIEPDLQSALRRVDANDALNGTWIRERMSSSAVMIKSLEDS